MKKVFSILMALLMVFALAALVFAESGAVAVSEPEPFTWADILIEVIVGLIGFIASIASIFVWKWIYPMLKNSIIPWLKDKNLLMIADAAVKYAESKLGRFMGEQKWDVARSWLASLGWDVNSEAVIAALKAAHYQLNLEMIKAGLKEPPIEPPE